MYTLSIICVVCRFDVRKGADSPQPSACMFLKILRNGRSFVVNLGPPREIYIPKSTF